MEKIIQSVKVYQNNNGYLWSMHRVLKTYFKTHGGTPEEYLGGPAFIIMRLGGNIQQCTESIEVRGISSSVQSQ